MKNELFVPEDIAVQLKEIGFDEPCFAGYQDNGMGQVKLFYKGSSTKSISTFPNVYGRYCHQNNHIVKAPLYQQVFGWFRDKGYNLYIQELSPECFSCVIGNSSRIGANTYKKAEDNGILWLISLIKG